MIVAMRDTVPVCPVCSETIQEGQRTCPNCASGTGVVEQGRAVPAWLGAFLTLGVVGVLLLGLVYLLVRLFMA
jgi:hypothetical protein